MNGWSLIYGVGAAQGLLLSVALWQRSRRPSLLAGWMLLIALDLAVRVWVMLAPSVTALRALRIVALLPFLHASLFYLYVRSVAHGRTLGWTDLRHGAGFALGLLLTLDLLLLPADAFMQALQQLREGGHHGRENLINLTLFGFSLSYVVAAVTLVLRYRNQLLQTRSDGDPEALRWLLWVAAWQALIWATALAQWLLPLPWLHYQLIYAAVAAFVLAVGYLSLLTPAEPSGAEAAPDAVADIPVTTAELAAVSRSAKAGAADGAGDDEDARFADVARRLLQLFEEERLYRRTALSMAQVAQRSGYPEYLVSAVINRRFGQPFWDWVNGYRVREAQACLLDPAEQRTALDIAYAVGFSSKSTFNAAFKRLLGETPSQCRTRARRASSATSDRAPSAAD